MATRRLLALADDLLNLLTGRLPVDSQRLQRPGGDALTLVEQAQQEVLGADRVVAQQPGLLSARTTTLRARSVNRWNIPRGCLRIVAFLILSASGSAGCPLIAASFTRAAPRSLGRSRGASQPATAVVSSLPAAISATTAATGSGGPGSISQPLRARNCSMAASATC
jgi:hypothetical protein